MNEKRYVSIHNTNEKVIDCFYCKYHDYDSFGEDDFEICEKGREIYPDDCEYFIEDY